MGKFLLGVLVGLLFAALACVIIILAIGKLASSKQAPTIAGLAHYLGEACPEVVRRVFGPESLSADDRRSAGVDGQRRPKPRELLVPAVEKVVVPVDS